LRKPSSIAVAAVVLIVFSAALSTAWLVHGAARTVVAVKPSAVSPQVGEAFTVNITVSDVENLYALDVLLTWNASILRVQSVQTLLGVESHSGGVLHETLPDAAVYIVENNISQEAGEYHLVATSVAPAPSFNGSGTIATITFTVLSTGRTALILSSELADYNPEGSNPINHEDVSGTVEALIPEFPATFALTVLMLVTATVALVYARMGKKK
jgi:hypothetical protein